MLAGLAAAGAAAGAAAVDVSDLLLNLSVLRYWTLQWCFSLWDFE
jgi:hypothetical protein